MIPSKAKYILIYKTQKNLIFLSKIKILIKTNKINNNLKMKISYFKTIIVINVDKNQLNFDTVAKNAWIMIYA